MFKEFKEFIMTGNVVDLAIAVILGAATSGVVNGFVQDIAMPIVGYLTGGTDFSDLKYILTPAVLGADGAVVTPENAIRYGSWINTLINLISVGFILFLVVRSYNKIRKPKEEAPAGPTEVELLTEIRDALKK